MDGNLDHPHARGEDEVFGFMYRFEFNVDLARRLIASGDVVAIDYEMPVRKAGERLLRLSPEEFGSAVGGVFPQVEGIDLLATAVDRDRLPLLPPDSFDKPGLMVMWDAVAGARLTTPRGKPPEPAVFPVLVDGNHRLARRYLEGFDGNLRAQVVRDWADIEKFLLVDGKPVRKRGEARPRRNGDHPATPSRR